MVRKTQHSFGGNILNLHLPLSWNELSEKQLRYVFFALYNFEPIRAKTYIFCRLLGIKVYKKSKDGWVCSIKLSLRKRQRFILQLWQVEYWLRSLDYIFQPSISPVRLARIKRRYPVDNLLHGVTFNDYICIENLYQGYLYKHDNKILVQMFQYLYKDNRNRIMKWVTPSPNNIELLSIFMWWGSVKRAYMEYFPHFFKRVVKDENSDNDSYNLLEVVNAQIRALTAGDITKEKEVLNMDCWRALTELNEKAREVEEWKKKYGRN